MDKSINRFHAKFPIYRSAKLPENIYAFSAEIPRTSFHAQASISIPAVAAKEQAREKKRKNK